MNTIIHKINPINPQLAVLQKAAYILKNNGLVSFPTETVYGLGANAFSSCAIKKIYTAKGRPSDNPLILHIANFSDIYKLTDNVSNIASDLINHFWPAPLTIIFKKSSLLPNDFSSGLDTIAIRMPQNLIARSLINICGFPIAAPSANLSGKPSPTSAKHVANDLSGKIDMILDGGGCQFGIESTVVDATNNDYITILRPGSITEKMLKSVCNKVYIDKGALNSKEFLPKSPGMKYKHYSPKGEITIFNGENTLVAQKILSLLNEDTLKNIKSGAILSDETLALNLNLKNFKVLNIGSYQNFDYIAKNLFAFLRQCDELNLQKIYVQSFPKNDVGVAIMNRLEKAAGYNIINL